MQYEWPAREGWMKGEVAIHILKVVGVWKWEQYRGGVVLKKKATDVMKEN